MISLKVTSLMLAISIAEMPMGNDPIATAIESFNKVESYSVTLRSLNNGASEEIKYYYKRPGFVRMEFVMPHNGAVLVYSPLKKEVRVRPFDFLKLLTFTFDPDNSLVKSSKGHRVDESDIGALLKTVKMLQGNGETEMLEDEAVGGRPALKVSVAGKGDFTVDGIHRYLLWFNKETRLPLKAAAYNSEGDLIEDVLMTDLKINVNFPEDFFNL